MHEHLSQHELDLIARGLARVHNGRLIPIMCGGDGTDEPLFPAVPDDLAALSADELSELATGLETAIREVTSDPASFVTAELPSADLVTATREASTALLAVRAQIETLAAEGDADEAAADEAAAEGEAEPVDEPVDEPSAEAAAAVDPSEAELEELAAIAASVEPEIVEPPAVVEPPAAIVAAATPPARPALARPARRATPAAALAIPRVSLTAAASGLGPFELGQVVSDPMAVARMMMARHSQFGGKGDGSKYPIVKASWLDQYGPERTLDSNPGRNMALVAAGTDGDLIKTEMRRRKSSLTASGGYCAPSTPLYQLAMYSTTSRPVRDSLPSYGADRGGVRLARPAALGAITTAIGRMSSADDLLGGTFATKTCQVVDCPPFTETLAEALWHCNQFGNMISRAFPELVNQWTDLTMAAHARLAESFLLTRIDEQSTQVTTGDLGLGATASLLPQILAAVNGMRSRHRMDPEAVLRIMLPDWSVDLLISDVIRSQFQRFDTDEAKITALLRSFDVEPTFYLDGAAGRGQVFGPQANHSALLGFPATVTWYLFPEGAFIYLDGGELELGVVRDSSLNSTNDFQVFGEIFENVALAGVEALAIESDVCASGAVSAPADVTCPVV